ncbi:MAG: hypothetical protein H5T86_16190, partial [Armatimonadetes bacterium]|nr:hypothetical protein [Armatimonadota bacterium]
VALYMAHDRVAFALHDLGHFVEDEASLAMALALGHQMSLSIATGTSEQTARFQWLRWLDTVQKHVACRYMPQPLTSFAHLTPLCVKAAYGPITVIASLEREPVSVDGVKVASPGFYARSANGAIEAGRLVEYAGRRYDPPLEFIRERGPAEEHWWLFGSSPVVLPADGARAAYEVLGTVRRQSKVVQSDQAKWIVATPPLLGAQPPAELAERPPAQWPQAPQYIGVVAMEPNGPDPAWSDAGPDKWIEALTKSDILSRLAIKVRKLRAPDEVLIACQQPRTVLAIINPYGERFPVEAPERAEAMLDAVSAYVRNGGIWWETGGYSFFYPCWPQRTNGRITGWQSGRGMGGLSHILGSPLVLPDGLPPEKLAVTDSARALLTAETASKLDGAEAVVNRPLPPEQDGWSLLVGPSGPYIAGYQLAGWGYLFRVGGVGRLEL